MIAPARRKLAVDTVARLTMREREIPAGRLDGRLGGANYPVFIRKLK